MAHVILILVSVPFPMGFGFFTALGLGLGLGGQDLALGFDNLPITSLEATFPNNLMVFSARNIVCLCFSYHHCHLHCDNLDNGGHYS